MERNRPLTRRAALSAALVGLTAKGAGRAIEGGFANESFALGHRLRDRQAFAIPAETVRVPVVIVGGGCAGLCAAWRLAKGGMRDFVILEMEAQAGGNARWGENEVSRYPWAAHYLPVANPESKLVRELCLELGLLQENGDWNERHLCFDPQERLFIHGRWQDGVEPEVGATSKDRDQYKRFSEKMREFRATGQFTKPLTVGVRPSVLDNLTMARWLADNRFDSPYLNWLVDYSCRDDYGGASTQVSAWAGIHEFASREPDERGPLTWPEGNGWIAERLLAGVRDRVRTSSPVLRVERDGAKARVVTPKTVFIADTVIFAAPSMLANYLIEGEPKAPFEYSPWMTANLTLDRLPRGPRAAWDNVIFGSPSLGYVDATHMSVATHQPQAVWTYYWALTDQPALAARRSLLAARYEELREQILSDLARAHPDIRECVKRVDIMRLGHAMVRPVPGFLNAPSARRWREPQWNGALHYANSDLSGISIFEEAQQRGVLAADHTLRRLGRG